MRAAIALRYVVGKTLCRLLIGVVPLHRDLDDDAVFFSGRVEDRLVQNALAAVHVFDKTLDPAAKSKCLFFTRALIDHGDLYAVIQKR